MQQPISTLDRVLAILDQFTDEQPHLTLSEIARAAELTTTTTHRLLGSMQERGLVRRLDNRRYALGPRLLRLAHRAHAQTEVREIARPIMRWLRDQTGETVGLHALDGRDRVVLDQVESREPLRRTYTDLGSPIPLNQGAPSKAMLAYLSESLRERVLSDGLGKATERTPVDAAALRAELTAIRSQGYALSFGEREPGISSVSVPVWNHTDTVTGSLSVTGPDSRLTIERLTKLAPLAVKAGRELSAALGSRREGP